MDKTKWILVGVGVVLLLGGFLFFRGCDSGGAADLRDALAKDFGVDADSLYVNLPPLPERYPSMLFDERFGLPESFTKANDPDLKRGTATDFRSAAALEGKFSGSVGAGVFGAVAKAGRDVSLEIQIPDLCAVEILKPTLVARIHQHYEGKPVPGDVNVILRAFEGHLTYRVKKKSSLSEEAWAKLQQDAQAKAHEQPGDVEVKVEGGAGSSKDLTVTTKEAVVIAYIACKAVELAANPTAAPRWAAPKPFDQDTHAAVLHLTSTKITPAAFELAVDELPDKAQAKVAAEEVVRTHPQDDAVRNRALMVKERVGRFVIHEPNR